MSSNQKGSQYTGLELAVIGMAGRFPGARNLNEFWNNLIKGIDSISFFTREELAESGIDFGILDNPGYVKAKGVLEDIEYFDASFFGHSPKEAEIMSPQTRMAYECAWEALEDAGYDPDAYDGAIGVFIGASHSVYWEALSFISGKSENFGEFEATMLNNKDFLSTRVSYKLDLKGPSFSIFTGCSTSGVAIHQACQSVLSGESHMALAGGVSIWLPKKSGYLYQEGSIFSKNGHCRTFDAAADGTAFGDGIGLVVLKALEDAIGDRDHIYAVIKGTGINNDGNRKVGYTAPSTEGEAAAIRAAHHMADVEPESISYIEAHGTGTPVGDPIEIEALKLAFNTNKKGFCRIGSVKSNIGHLNTASGVSGFIKAVLALKYRLIPPTINYSEPNPKIDFDNSPFRVNTQLTPWENDRYPLRAGVSSFGVGGTNIHIVLEEAPGNKPQKTHSRPYQLILLSAKTQTALGRMTENLANYIKKNLANPGTPGNPGLTLADAAYTLQVGRRPFKHRRMMVCSTDKMEEDVHKLLSPGPDVCTYDSPVENGSIIFMFPGQGSQYVNMGRDLYEREPVFREQMDRCFEILNRYVDFDIKEILYAHSDYRGGSLYLPQDCVGSPGQGDHSGSSLQPDRINQTEIAQPLLFAFEYALAKLMMNWGITPKAMMGHSIGEYTAACLAGVFSLEDTSKLVALRGRLMAQMPPGAMLGVQLPENELTPLLNDPLALAAVNGPSDCVVSGPHEVVRTFREKLKEKGIKTRYLHTSHAFHSAMMDPILNPFTQEAQKLQGHQIEIPYISNISGTWMTEKEAANPAYWSNHLRRTVRFLDGVKELLKIKHPILVEVGPGNVLGTLVRKIPDTKTKTLQPIVSLVRHPQENAPDDRYLLDKLGRLWLFGTTVNWEAFYSGESRYRISLPTYPFEGQYYWIEGNPFKMVPSTTPGASTSIIQKKPDISDWFYIPLWKQSIPQEPVSNNKKVPEKYCWMVFGEENVLAPSLGKLLMDEEQDVIIVKPGGEFLKESDSIYTINPGQKGDYETLFKELHAQDRHPEKVLHLWGINTSQDQAESSEIARFKAAQDRGFYSLIYLAQALGKRDRYQYSSIVVVTNDMQNISGEETLSPEKATVLGPVITINQEFPNINCRSIDVHLPETQAGPGNLGEEKLARQLLWESREDAPDIVAAYRNNHCWIPIFEPIKLQKPKQDIPLLRKNGIYLITGGLGGIGFILAKALVQSMGAKLVLTGRSQLPPEDQWDKWLTTHHHNEPLVQKIKKVLELKKSGTEVLVFSVNVDDKGQMEKVIRTAEERLGPINGVIHAAGIVGEQAFRTLDQLDKPDCRRQFQAKIHGLNTLDALFQDRDLDFCLLMSSIASQLGGLGLTAYSAANIFMDAFVKKQKRNSRFPWISVNWDVWQSNQEIPGDKKDLFDAVLGQLSMTPEQGVNALYRILEQHRSNNVVVSTGDLGARLDRWTRVKPVQPRDKKPGSLTTYVQPRNQLESIITEVIRQYLGIEQVGIHDSFFDLGATSLDLAQINSKLNAVLEAEIPLVNLLTYPTVASFTNHIMEDVWGNRPDQKEPVVPPTALDNKSVPGNEPMPAPEYTENLAPEPGKKPETWSGQEIAVVGMAGRFPGANNIDEFWENLKNGVESISFFSDEELQTSGEARELLEHPDYVKVKGIIAGVDYFDASFFDYTPREAEMMDPQARIFHECVWETMENAGYDPYTYPKAIGLYVAANPHYYWDALYTYRQFERPSEQFEAFQFYDKDFMSTRISYKLNLKGPAFTMYTACSSSLVAVHLASQALLGDECHMALAGGVSVWLPEKIGYLYEEGMILSADGHNRTFDEKGKGSIFGDGVGVVLLKRLPNALADRDTIHAVLKGSAINNDGSRKLAYTAPSVEGQAEVITAALKMAAVAPQSISYLEAHGTATPLGDVVEMEALNRVFCKVKQKNFCAIGSVKTNVGHLNSAAGITGLIKTILALKHRQLPPSLYFEIPNPEIDFVNSPFYVTTQLKEWNNHQYPLRAGISAFGIGGTNAHVVLEEWPTAQGAESEGRAGVSPLYQSRELQLILLSAKTQSALDKMAQNLAEHFKKNRDINLADAAYTLQVGRRAFQYRRTLVCSDNIDTIDGLSTPCSQKVKTHLSKDNRKTVAFMFPGVGAQHVNMGQELYEKEPTFRKEMDRCFEVLQPIMGYDIKEILYPTHPAPSGHPSQEGNTGGSPYLLKDCVEYAEQGDHKGSPPQSDQINQTEISQLLIFIVEYALAKLLMYWGIMPHVMIGYSFGEYAAACIAGVFSLEDALQLVKTLIDLIRQTPPGAMLSVPLPVEELKSLMDNHDNVSIAIDNGPSTIVSGIEEAINAFEKKMKTRKYICMRVDNTRALHAKEMEPILKLFELQVAKVTLNEPQIPYISNVTGNTVNGNDVTHPQYWSKHLREMVQFANGIKKLAAEPDVVFIEIGPGRDLSALVEGYLNKDDRFNQEVIHLMPPKQKKVSGMHYLLSKLGQLWLYNVTINWANFYHGEERHRIPLPTYPFEGRCFKIEDLPRSTDAGSPFKYSPGIRKKNMNQWFYVPSWKRSGLPNLAMGRETPSQFYGPYLVFVDDAGLGSRLKEQIIKKGQEIITVKPGNTFLKINQHQYIINPSHGEDYHRLLKELQKENQEPGIIVFLWAITNIDDTTSKSIQDRVYSAVVREYHALLFLAKAIGAQQITREIHLEVITNNMHEVNGGEGLYPEKAVTLGPCKVIPLEYPNIRCRSIDVVFQDSEDDAPGRIVDRLLTEFTTESFEPIVAHRGNFRWVQTFDPYPLDKYEDRSPLLKEKDVYLVIGGLGGIGLILAEYMAKRVQPCLILTGRSAFPPREQWEQYLTAANGKSTDGVKAKIRKLLELEKHAAGLLVLNADVTDQEQMQEVFEKGEAQFGPINGVIHAAGLPDGKMIQLRSEEDSERILASKITGTLVLDRILKEKKPRFFILCSSIAAIVPFVGQVSYCSANAFLDAYSLGKSIIGDMVTISINWDRWQNVGFSTIIENLHKSLTGEELTGGITSLEGVEAFARILNRPVPQVVVSPCDLNEMIRRSGTFNESSFLDIIDENTIPGIKQQRPQLETKYIAPETETEKIISSIWSTFFGYEKIGIHDDFFELGGDSLKAIAIISKINKKLNINVPISVLFNNLTLKGIVEYIDQTTSTTTTLPSLFIEPVENKEYYETTVTQKKFFLLSEMKGLDNALNISNILAMEGKLDKQRLTECLQALIRRHESFRTSFHVIDGRILMKTHEYDTIDLAIEYIELPKDREDELQSIKKNFSTPFDLTKPPLIKAALVKLEEEKHLLLLDFSHMITDDTSVGILVKELSVLYKKENLPELKIRYKDYAEWQKKFLASQEGKKQEKYWLEEFAGEVALLNMHTDYPRPKIRRFEGDWIRFNLEDQLLQKLEQLRKDTAATLYMILLTALNILLSKYSNQTDITIASPVIGREQEELEDIVGLFINLLPMRNFPQPHKTFLDFLNEVKKNAQAAYENQLYPLGNLVEKLGLQKDLSRNPLNDVQLIMVNTDISVLDMEELHFYQEEYDQDKSMVDISLEVTELQDTVSFNLIYSSKLFKRETMERFINSFKEILLIITENRDILLQDITLSSALEEANSIFQEDTNPGDFGFSL